MNTNANYDWMKAKLYPNSEFYSDDTIEYVTSDSSIHIAYEAETNALDAALQDYEENGQGVAELYLYKNVINKDDTLYYDYFFDTDDCSENGTMFKKIENKLNENGEIIETDPALVSNDAFFEEFQDSYWDDAWTLHEDAII